MLQLLVILGSAILVGQPTSIDSVEVAVEARLESPSGVAFDSHGHLYIAERRANRIRSVNAETGAITTVVGTGTRAFGGDGGPASEALISIPEIITIDRNDNLYITDRGNARIRKVNLRTGIISTIAGNGEVGYSGDGGPATEAALSYPFGVAVDGSGNVYIADTENHVIRRIDAASGLISTVAGVGEAGFSGDGGPASEAALNRPHGVLIDPRGNLVIADSENQRVRMIDDNGTITTLYGTGEQAAGEDGILASESPFFYFGSLLFDHEGAMLIAGWVDNRIRRVDPVSGVITTIVGTGESGFSGDGGPAAEARIHGPYGMTLDAAGNLHFADAQNDRVRRVDVQSGVITTVAGGGSTE